jgi:hypothetical protein
MAGSASPTVNAPLLKRLYGKNVSETTYKRDALLERASKDKNFRGLGREVTIAIAATAGGSADFAGAVESQEATVERTFFVTHRKEYQVYTIQNDAIERSMGDAAALVSILKRQVGGAKRKFDESMARRTHGKGGGALGQLALNTTLTGNTVIFRKRSDIVGTIEKNLLIDFASDDGTGTSPSGLLPGGPLKVLSVNRKAGTMVLNTTIDTAVGVTNNSYFFRRKDYGVAMTGLGGWSPTVDPTSALFFGVDRTEDITKESGYRIAGGGRPKDEVLQEAGAEAMTNGISAKLCVVNPRDFMDIGMELNASKVQEGGTAVMGFSKLICHLAIGEVEIVQSPYMPEGEFRLLDPENFHLGTAGDCPKDLAASVGGKLLLPTADAWQGRLGCYGNFWLDDPGQVLVGTW